MGLEDIEAVIMATPPYAPDARAPAFVQPGSKLRECTAVELREVWDLVREVRLRHQLFSSVDLAWILDLAGNPALSIDAFVEDRDAFVNTGADADASVFGVNVDVTFRREPDRSRIRVSARRSLDVVRCLGEVRHTGWNEACLFVGRSARELLIDFLTHEADEMLVVRGERVFDPHLPPFRYRVPDEGSVP